MPGYRLHIFGGLITFIGIAFLCSKLLCGTLPATINLFQWALFCILGALFPDVDTKSKGQGIFYKVMLFILIFLLWKKKWSLFVFLSFVSLVPVLSRHRGLFHRVWFVTTIPLTIAFIAGLSFPAYNTLFLSNAIFFICGALSHIALDKVPYLS